MSKLYTLILIFVCCFLLHTDSVQSQNCTYTWSPQTPGTTNILYTVKAVNETICWVAGDAGNVRRTTNGGLTWTNGNPNPGVITGHIYHIEALDENNAWATTSTHTICRTSNGGVNWLLVYTSANALNGIKMENLSTGIALGDPISNTWNIIRTTNGGLNWIPLTNLPAAQAGESGFKKSFHVSFPNIWFGSSFGSVFRSTDNGQTWTNHVTPGLAIYVLAVYFNSANLGFASSTTMVKSVNGGENYAQHPVMGAGNIDNIDGSGNNFWYVRGEKIYHSSNSGDNWIQVHTAPSTLQDIDVVDNSSGCLTAWAVGLGGNVIKMTDGIVGITSNDPALPQTYTLNQNYPNPFNPSTNISFSIPEPGSTKLKIYDVLGNEITEVISSYLTAGSHSVTFNAENLTSGIYTYTLTSGSYSESRKMVLIK